MILSGKLTFNAVAVKLIEIEPEKKSSIISISEEKDPKPDKLTDYPDHPLQGEVVGVGESVTQCKVGDVVLFKLSSNWTPSPYVINDKGTIYQLYNEGDIAIVREEK